MKNDKIIEFPGKQPGPRYSVKEDLVLKRIKEIMPTMAMITQGLYNYCTLLDANTDPAELENNKANRISTKLHNAATAMNNALGILDGIIPKEQSVNKGEEAADPDGKE